MFGSRFIMAASRSRQLFSDSFSIRLIREVRGNVVLCRAFCVENAPKKDSDKQKPNESANEEETDYDGKRAEDYDDLRPVSKVCLVS